MTRTILVVASVLSMFLSPGSLWAAPTTAEDAQMAVTGWLMLDPQPFGLPSNSHVSHVETFTDGIDTPLYYVVYLNPSGFVVVSADDSIEPIIAFAAEGVYQPTPEDPLRGLVAYDLHQRVQTVQRAALPSSLSTQAASATQEKWCDLISAAWTPIGELKALACPISPSDIRVAPFLETRWGQKNVKGGTLPCYNFYTPQIDEERDIRWGPLNDKNSDNYYCGCVATAMAQLMYYHKYPVDRVGDAEYDVSVIWLTIGDVSWAKQTKRTLRGGNGWGGPYNWDNMRLSPDSTASETVRSAIGSLCYDAGLSVGMAYGSGGSSTGTSGAAALRRVFQYSNAVEAKNGEVNIGSGLTGMINPNLDAMNPVILGLKGPEGGHAAIVDGYGYDWAGSPYHHLNMGWTGTNDCWYNLPEVKCPDPPHYEFGVVTNCSYNIFKKADNGAWVTGEIISGRVTDQGGYPISGVQVTAVWKSSPSGVNVEGDQVEVETEQVEVEQEYPSVEPEIPGTSVEVETEQAEVEQDTVTVEPEFVPPDWSVTTNSQGIYAMVGVASGTTYTISAQKDGHQFTSRDVTTGTSVDGRDTSGNCWGINFQGQATGRMLTVNGPAQAGAVSAAGGADWWQFTVASIAACKIETWTGSLSDTVMSLYGPNSDKTLIETNDDAVGLAARIIRSLSPGTYHVKVTGFNASATGTYTIRVTTGASSSSSTVRISGHVRTPSGGGVADVRIDASNGGGSDTTDTSGAFVLNVPWGWSGILTPSLSEYRFSPSKQGFLEIVAPQTCDFTATETTPVTISGYVYVGSNSFNRLSGVTITASPGFYSDTTDSDGAYTLTVPHGWSGTVTPQKSSYWFYPITEDFSNLESDMWRNFQATWMGQF